MTSQHVDRVVPERLLLSSECMMGVWVWHFRSNGQSHSVVCRRFLVDYQIKVNNKCEVRQKWKPWFDICQWNIDEFWSVSSADRKLKWLLSKFHQKVPPVIFHHAFILQNISLNRALIWWPTGNQTPHTHTHTHTRTHTHTCAVSSSLVVSCSAVSLQTQSAAFCLEHFEDSYYSFLGLTQPSSARLTSPASHSFLLTTSQGPVSPMTDPISNQLDLYLPSCLTPGPSRFLPHPPSDAVSSVCKVWRFHPQPAGFFV